MKRYTLLLYIFFTIPLAAQKERPPLVTDRPDQTESSVVVPHKSLQIETGFLMEKDETAILDITSYALNSTLLRYGLLDNLELRLGASFSLDHSDAKGTGLRVANKGLSPLYAGFKIQVAHEAGWIPEIALLGSLELPFTAENFYKTDFTGGGMRFALSHSLGNRFSTGVNLGADWDGEQAAPSYYYSLVFGGGITDGLGFFVESYGTLNEGGGGEHLLDAGLTYLISPVFQIDVSGGLGLNEAAIKSFLSLGLSYRIDKQH